MKKYCKKNSKEPKKLLTCSQKKKISKKELKWGH